jgi:hypothetical protein
MIPDLTLITDIYVPQKPKAKAAPKKPAATKPAAKKTTQTTLKAKPATKPAAKKKAKAESEDEPSDIEMSDAESLLSHTPPKAKKATAPKRAGSKPLADVENESHGGDADGASKSGNASEKYQKVSFRSLCHDVNFRWVLIAISYSSPNLNTLSNVLIPTLDPPNAPHSRCGFTTP